MARTDQSSTLPPQDWSRALEKGLQVLEVLTESESPHSLTDLASRIGLGKSSTQRLLNTLVAKSYLRQMADRRYGPSLRLGRERGLERLARVALPVMKDVNHETAETVSLAVLVEHRIEVIEVLESPQQQKVSNAPGRIMPPHASSLGKAVLSFQTAAKQLKILLAYGEYRFTEKTKTTREDIMDELRRVKDNGWACDDEESINGAVCYGAPIFVGKNVPAAISVSALASRLTSQPEEKETRDRDSGRQRKSRHEEVMLRAVVEGAKKISKQLLP